MLNELPLLRSTRCILLIKILRGRTRGITTNDAPSSKGLYGNNNAIAISTEPITVSVTNKCRGAAAPAEATDGPESGMEACDGVRAC